MGENGTRPAPPLAVPKVIVTGPRPVMVSGMRQWLILVAHLVVTIIKVAAPAGARSVVAKSLIVKHQLLIPLPGRAGSLADDLTPRPLPGWY
jgi:hypothetical protein